MAQGPAQPNTPFGPREIRRGIESLAMAIAARHPRPSELALVGVHTGGDTLLRRVEAAMAQALPQKDLDLDKGLLEISFYRDDWSRLNQMPSPRATDIPFDVNNRNIILIDDVIFTGRTVRASLDALFSLGRPARVELAVLVDRGHREFPIEPDYVGLHLPTERHQAVNVFLADDPEQDYVTLEDNKYRMVS